MPDKSPLRQLVDIISTSVDQIESQFDKSQLQFPSLDVPYNSSSPAETAARSPEVADAARLIVAACGQLSTMVQVPAQTIYDDILHFHLASCIRVACQGNIVEILREAGGQGLHTRDIAAKTGLDPLKLARVLRLLATHHIFREISPDVFANNRLSSVMDTFKSVSEIKARPEEKHTGTPGLAAEYEQASDEMFKGAAYMTDTLFDPITGHSDAPEHAPITAAFKSNKGLWEWYEESGNEMRHKRFGAMMVGGGGMDPPDAILRGFDWSNLAPRSVVVDVGGGIGSTSLRIAKKFPALRYVVQDRPATIEDAKEYWKSNLPYALEDGSVELRAHDFFTPQPRKDAAVFLLRKIIHDYGRANAILILKHLRAAANPETKLVIVDQILSYVCLDDPDIALGKHIQGAEQPKAPSPLLPNFGKASLNSYHSDFQMFVGLNAEERTLGAFIDITQESGWKIQRVFVIPGSPNKHLVAIPA